MPEQVRRFDYAGNASGAEVTPEGFLRARGLISRVGVQEYRRPDGTVRRELRTPEEVFHPDSLASLRLLPLTDEHPPAVVDASNAKAFQVGHLGESVQPEAETYVGAPLMVTDARLVARVLDGTQAELSVGYFCDLVEEPGTWNGQAYDAIQTRIRGNHVALTRSGRAGPAVRVRLDAGDAVLVSHTDRAISDAGAPSLPAPGDTMTTKTITLLGLAVAVPEALAPALEQAQQRADADLAAARKETTVQQARADTAAAELATERKLRTDAQDPKRLADAVRTRVTLEREAGEVLGAEAKLDGMDDNAIRVAVLGKLSPALRLDGQGADYVLAAYDAARAMRATAGAAGVRTAATAVPTPGGAPRQDARTERMDADANAWKSPTIGMTLKQ